MGAINLLLFRKTQEWLREAIEGLTEEQLRQREAPGKWSINEVLGHLADHSIVISFRIRDILADTDVTLPKFNQDRWVVGQRANEVASEELLGLFGSLLHYNSLLLERLSSSELDKSGLNFKGDVVSIADIVSGFVRHVGTHLSQIDRIKTALSAVH